MKFALNMTSDYHWSYLDIIEKCIKNKSLTVGFRKIYIYNSLKTFGKIL